MMRGIVVGLLGLCAVAAFLLSKRASAPAVKLNEDLRRWEDDGGHQPAVTVDIHST